MSKRKVGYWVYSYGDRSWHRTLKGALRRFGVNLAWCDQGQVVEVSSGALVAGRAL